MSRRPQRPARSATSPLASARGVASTVLHRVVTDGAYAARALDAEIEAAGLSERDARLATEIVYGTLRTLPLLDARLDRELARGRPDPFAFATLRAATYQALCLGRVPDHAIVQESVNIVKHKRGEGLGKLTNAVLRRIVAERPEQPAPPAQLCVPEWVERSLEAGLGSARCQAFLSAANAVPPLGLRVREGIDCAGLLETLRTAHPDAQVEASPLSPRVVLARGIGDPRRLPGYAEGHFVVQDEGAGLVGRLLGARQGERVLDACAGRGGKTLQLLEAVGPTGQVTAVDVHARKLEQLREEAARLGLSAANLTTETIDLSVGDGGLQGGFDRVLVDAPCTGLGTLRRRPEISLRLQPRDPGRLADLQLGIVRRALGLLRPGGILVFAVCSGSREEARGVADRLEAGTGAIRRLGNSVEGVPLTADDDEIFRIGPWLSTAGALPDVYQVVRWEMLDSHVGGV